MQKGGIGKTTTCSNLGIGLAQEGKKVLIVDSDPQGSLYISLGHAQPDNIPTTLARVSPKFTNRLSRFAPCKALLVYSYMAFH